MPTEYTVIFTDACFTCIVTYTYSYKAEPVHDKNNKMICVPSEDSDQPEHSPNLIRVFTVRMKKHWDLSYPLGVSEVSDLSGLMPRLIWDFAGRNCHLFVLSYGGSNSILQIFSTFFVLKYATKNENPRTNKKLTPQKNWVGSNERENLKQKKSLYSREKINFRHVI